MVWTANGLLCKVFDLVPRHRLIVAKILGSDYSQALNILIGLLETGMAIWIISGIKSRLNTIVQIVVILTMNILEFLLAPDLLLWGKFNLVFATLFSFLIYYNGIYLANKSVQQV